MVQLEVKSNFTVALLSVFMMLRIFKHVYLLIKSKILIDRDHASFFFPLSQCFHNTFQRGSVCWIWIHLKWDWHRYHVIKEKLGDERRAGWKGKLYYKNLGIWIIRYTRGIESPNYFIHKYIQFFLLNILRGILHTTTY